MALVGTQLSWTANWNAPWLALLAINFTTVPIQDGQINHGQKFCAGAFVGKQWILTATSCLSQGRDLPQPNEVTVMTGWGSFDCVQEGQWGFKTLAAEIETCPNDEKGNKLCDLMMVRARRTAFRVPPAKIGLTATAGNRQCRLLSFDGRLASPRPKTNKYWTPEPGFVHMKTIQCNLTGGGFKGFTNRNNVICAYTDNMEKGPPLLICPEKNGGVLQCGSDLVGILTEDGLERGQVGEDCEHETEADVERMHLYEDVTRHRQWIETTIQEAYDFLHDDNPPPGWVQPIHHPHWSEQTELSDHIEDVEEVVTIITDEPDEDENDDEEEKEEEEEAASHDKKLVVQHDLDVDRERAILPLSLVFVFMIGSIYILNMLIICLRNRTRLVIDV